MTEPTVTQEVFLRAIVSKHTGFGLVDGYGVAKDAYLFAERATIERVVKWLKGQPEGHAGDYARGFAFAIERGEWKDMGHDS